MSPLAHLTADQWPAVSALLDEALALPAAERDTWLQSLDGERAALKDTLRELFSRAGGAETDDFLATLPHFTRVASTGPLTELAANDAIGPYRLLSELGTGGMGAVWLAERSDGTLKRKVALKLPRMVWARGLAERMARERDILASLEHPNIARLYDAGVDQHGRPYLALEYVEGQPIDAFAMQRDLSVRQKLDLLLQVCAAVAFAHSRLVVHRDLKPSNILVTAEGQVRLLDFGIAKLMEGDITKETQLTQMAGRALTLDYASPEQIRGGPIGTASDVYSLAVVFYELLTGGKPYKLKRGSAAELEEAIASVDAAKASDAANSASKRALRGDLDAILNKALKKRPEERYATIDALAQDITRHLNSEPVSAQPDAFAYRAVKFMWRYRVQASAATAVALVAGAGLSAVLWQAAEVQRQRDRAVASAAAADRNAARAEEAAQRALAEGARADAERQAALRSADAAQSAARRAERSADEARRQEATARAEQRRAEEVKRFVGSIFTSATPRSGAGGQVTAADLLRAASGRIERELGDQPQVAAELSALIGDAYSSLGELRSGYEFLKDAVPRLERSVGVRHPDVLRARYRQVEAANVTGDLDTAARLLPQLIRDIEASPSAPPALLVGALRSHSFVLARQNREAESVAQARRAVEAATTRLPPEDDMRFAVRGFLSNTYAHFGRNKEALESIEPVAAEAARLWGGQRPHPQLAVIERWYADALGRNGEGRRAAALLQQVLDDVRALDQVETPRVRATLTALAGTLHTFGDWHRALALVREALAMDQRLSVKPSNERVAMMITTGVILVQLGRHDEALAQFDAAERMAADSGAEPAFGIGARLTWRAFALASLGRAQEALDVADQAVSTLANLPAPRALAAVMRAKAMRHLGRIEEAITVAHAASEAARPQNARLVIVRADIELAECMAALGRRQEANTYFTSAIEALRAAQFEESPLIEQLEARRAAVSA